MGQDLTVPVGKEGMVNLRVGAILRRGNRILMALDHRDNAYYTLGGRIQFGETAEEAIQRELKEELGFSLPVKELAYIDETFFYGDYERLGYKKLVYETCWYFLLEVPEDLDTLLSANLGDETRNLSWIDIDTPQVYYPSFLREELKKPFSGFKHMVSDERH